MAVAVDRGDNVHIQIKPIYNPTNYTRRPDKFEVDWLINGSGKNGGGVTLYNN